VRAITMLLVFLLSATMVAREPKPSFDLASIRLNQSGPPPRGPTRLQRNTPNGMTATNVTVQTLIQLAYGVPRERIIGGPGWLQTEGFDIEAVQAPTAN
jgi:uncharacterized protein (TIGR03435 family)